MDANAVREQNRLPIRVGISTCPNDTFAFHALMNHKVDWRGLEFQIQLLDIQELNDRLFLGEFDVAKTSFHAALLLADNYVVLPSGSALGFGVGPLLLAADPDSRPNNPQQLALCPGQHTTATMLFRLFHANTAAVQQCVFSEVMPRLQNGTADFGVCIHEGRFTWQQAGLSLVEDLGTRWEAETNCPLPLGGLVASRSLGDETVALVQEVVSDSIQYGLANRDQTLPTMRQHAQEFDDDVLMQHVDLYVNEWTQDLGTVGANALSRLSEMAKSIGITGNQSELEIWQKATS
jgi:1,4-dihydroxy-6-naphthoate synthase